MTERPFETRLARDLVALADEGVRPVDARRLALAIVGTGRPARARLVLGFTSSRARWLVVAAILLLVLALGALLVGGLATQRHRLGPLLFVRAGGLWAAAANGSDQRLVADAGPDRQEYLYVRWSPDGNLLVAVRDMGDINLVPAVELFDRSGRRLWTKALDPGGLPDVSWAPDSRRLAIAAFPTVVPTDGDLLTPYPADAISPISLTILAVDGPGTVVSLRAAAPSFVRPPDVHTTLWTDPWVRWSPTSDAIALKALGQTCCETELWTVSSDGSQKHRVVGPAADAVPSWFAWRPNGRDLDFVGPARDATCRGGELVGSVCTAGFWTTDLGGAVSFTAVPGVTGGLREGDSFIQSLAWFADQRRVALAWGSIQFPTDPTTAECSARLDVFDPATSARTTSLSGTWQLQNDGVVPTSISGEAVASQSLAWEADSTNLFRLGAGAGAATSPAWSIRFSDVASGGPSSTAVDDVTHFDLASRP